MSLTPDECMSRALDLALDYPFTTLPNPRVGAVIVYDGRILAGGYHRGPGTPHAEAHAIEVAEKMGFKDFKNAELFVTMEPCCHKNAAKRTPPCAPLIASKKFKRVWISHLDPNPLVNGKGIQQLKKAGISVKTGLLGEVTPLINQAFLKNQKEKKSYVTLKMAMTFDGKMADDYGKSKWITTSASRMDAHWLRAKVDAIAVGRNTIEADNPSLNVRISKLHPIPRKIVIFGQPRNFSNKLKVIKANGKNQVLVIDDKKRDLDKLLKELYTQRDICHLLIEGGPHLSGRFLDEGLVDEIVVYYGKGFLGGQATYSLGKDWGSMRLEKAIRFTPDDVRLIGPDVVVQGFMKHYNPDKKRSGR